jgi:hypothetical protein
MNDHLGQLQQALSDAATREYGDRARGRASRDATFPARNIGSQGLGDRWRSVRRWSPFAVAVLLLAIVAAAGAAIVVLVDRGSAPLNGTVPSLRVLHYDVSLIPDLEAGDAGWCSFPRFWISGVSSPYDGGGTCAPAYRPGFPIVSSAEQPISNARNLLRSSHTALTALQGNSNLFSAIVTSRVAAIRLRPGDIVTARVDHRLAPGWKAVIAFVSGQIDPVALDSAGRVIPETGTAPQLMRAASSAYVPGRSAASSPCSIRAPRLPYVTAAWGVIATHVPTLGASVAANVLFSCARSWYSIKGYSEAASAAILLDAQHPHRVAPALPGLTPTGNPGIFAEDGGAAGPLLARRVGRAWLVVQGPSTSIDLLLLDSLHAEGRAVGSAGQR